MAPPPHRRAAIGSLQNHVHLPLAASRSIAKEIPARNQILRGSKEGVHGPDQLDPPAPRSPDEHAARLDDIGTVMQGRQMQRRQTILIRPACALWMDAQQG